jgi:hypothetical protein
MKAALEHLVRCCHGDERPDCPILDSLSNGNTGVQIEGTPPATARRGKVAAGRRAS